MIYCIDRFEGEIAICETKARERVEFNKNELYENAKEGDWFEKTEGVCHFLKEETAIRRQRNIDKLKSLMNKKA